MYNLPEFQRQVVAQQNPYLAISPYGKLHAKALATQLGRQLQYQQIAQQERMNKLSHKANMMGLKNQMGQLKLRKKQFRQEQEMYPWELGLGALTSGLNIWQQYQKRKADEAQISRHRNEMEALRYAIAHRGGK